MSSVGGRANGLAFSRCSLFSLSIYLSSTTPSLFLLQLQKTTSSSIKDELAQPHPADAAATYGSSLLAGGNYKSGGQLQPPPAPSPRRQNSSTAAAPFSTEANAAQGCPHALNSEGSRARNNYARPAGQQNVGNYLTGRPSSRVLAPPGGATSLVFGDDGSEGGVGAAASGAASSRAPVAVARAPYAQDGDEEEMMVASAHGQEQEQQEEQEAAAAEQEQKEPAAPVPNAPSARVNFGVSGIGQGECHAAEKGAASNNNYVRSEGQNVGNFLSGRPTSRVLAPPGGKSSITFG